MGDGYFVSLILKYSILNENIPSIIIVTREYNDNDYLTDLFEEDNVKTLIIFH